MALEIDNKEHARRPIGFVVVGLLLLLVTCYMAYDIVQRKSAAVPASAAYEYKINQSLSSSLSYFDSSFFNNGPGGNTAYVSALTDTITAAFMYNYHASETADITYTYDVKAIVRGNYALQSDSQGMASVWSKEDVLVKPITETVNSRDIVISPKVRVAYADYKKDIEQLKTALTLPLSSELTVQLTVRVSGTIGGTEFSDNRVATVSAPLDQSIYMLNVKYDKEDKKQVVPQAEQKSRDAFQQYEIIIAIVLGALGLAAIIFGLRKQIFKTPYQRELERIYRLHDGIIIKASKPADLGDKNVVPVQSFDDMLNLEEELKAPIVASPAGSEATQFMIIRDNVAYLYTLGKVILDDDVTTGLVEAYGAKPVSKRRK
ncbi:MAG: DUF5305 family protein [Candidatus Saccharimonas sp.]